ncbi:MAG: hypothetical protein JSW73_00960 [Candidatus Woesearchaeota archaeon]|nr:MAG: hypothetical protein JSW73_00960 [Candidatus Woesearchaeota archaeon]
MLNLADRPLGVTIIAVLGILGALITILGGLGASVGGTFLSTFSGGTVAGLISGALLIALGIVLIIVGIIWLVSYYWLFKMKKLGWQLVIIFGIISLILNIIGFAAASKLGIVLTVIIIVYLWIKKDLFT